MHNYNNYVLYIIAPNPVDFDTIEVLTTNTSYIIIIWKVHMNTCVIHYAMHSIYVCS